MLAWEVRKYLHQEAVIDVTNIEVYKEEQYCSLCNISQIQEYCDSYGYPGLIVDIIQQFDCMYLDQILL